MAGSTPASVTAEALAPLPPSATSPWHEAWRRFRRPLPPFAEVVRRGGLEVEDGLVGHPGTDWDQVRWAESPDPEDAWGFEPPDVVH